MIFKAVQLEEGQKILLNHGNGPLTEYLPIEKANQRILAKDVYSPINIPSFKKSPLDGFAFRASDSIGASKTNPLSIKIIDEVQAGDTRQFNNLPIGCGVKILTGAPIPDGADVVVRQEDLVLHNSEIQLIQELPQDSNIVFLGSDIKFGEKIISRGESLTPYHIGALAAMGISNIEVYKRPQVSVLSTGDELKSPGEELEHGQIFNSNLPSLIALINSLGGEGISLGNIPDNVLLIENIITKAIINSDLIITTGGASVGDYDLIERVLINMGASILFNRLHIKPGSPVIAGVLQGKLVIGLSGNPAAALISFELLVRPLINKLKGLRNIMYPTFKVRLVDGFNKESNQRRFLRVQVGYDDGQLIAKQTGKQQSGILRSMLGCNALVDIPPGTANIPPGTIVNVIYLKEEF